MNKIVTIGLGAAAVVVALFVGAQLFGSPSGGIGGAPAGCASRPPPSRPPAPNHPRRPHPPRR